MLAEKNILPMAMLKFIRISQNYKSERSFRNMFSPVCLGSGQDSATNDSREAAKERIQQLLLLAMGLHYIYIAPNISSHMVHFLHVFSCWYSAKFTKRKYILASKYKRMISQQQINTSICDQLCPLELWKNLFIALPWYFSFHQKAQPCLHRT